ncbi:MAG: hypothetical protein P1U67_01985 [Alcanivoracaceae bacterium]|nr:hypothetical protein [Alcanivoracaceae bacterium]
MASETLPDSSESAAEDTPQQRAAMEKRFNSPAMNSEEMQGLYLQSPIELDNIEEEGLRSVADQNRYSETDLLFRERLNSRNEATGPTPEFERPPIALPPPSNIPQL